MAHGFSVVVAVCTTKVVYATGLEPMLVAYVAITRPTIVITHLDRLDYRDCRCYFADILVAIMSIRDLVFLEQRPI